MKQGSGILFFAADQPYTGPTVVSNGILSLGASGLPITSGLLVWLDAADASTVTKDGGNLVSAWASKGSYTGSVSAAGTYRPTFTSSALNGRSTIRFDDTQPNHMENVGALTTANFANSNASMFVVWTLNNDIYYNVVSTAQSGQEHWRFTTGNAYFSMFKTTRINGTVPMPSTGSHLLEVTTSAADNTYKIWVDGVNKIDTTWDWALQTTLMLGYAQTANHLNGDIAETLIYTNALSDVDRQKVQGYLNIKWGLGLPSRNSGIALAGSSQLTVASGATLDLSGATNAMLNTNAFVRLSGIMALSAGSTQTVRRLALNSEDMPNGTWGGTGSGAAHVNPIFFSGTGVLKVTDAVRGTVIGIR